MEQQGRGGEGGGEAERLVDRLTGGVEGSAGGDEGVGKVELPAGREAPVVGIEADGHRGAGRACEGDAADCCEKLESQNPPRRRPRHAHEDVPDAEAKCEPYGLAGVPP